jgi:predicted amidohydrolase YtcJ
MLADGAFFALNMRMNAPGYSDGHLGKWITEPEVLEAQFKRFWDSGFSLHIHVNGDEGLDVVLDRLAALPVRRQQTITLEHLGYSTEAQNRRIAQLGLMVSAQPNYIRVLGDAYALTGLGPDRAATINRLGSLERKGVQHGPDRSTLSRLGRSEPRYTGRQCPRASRAAEPRQGAARDHH